MDSSSPSRIRRGRHNDAKDVPKQYCDSTTSFKYPSSRRTTSFSSNSSFSPSSSSIESFFFQDDPLLSPATPLRFSGVPFSWEHLPGIPKKQNSKKINNIQEKSIKLLPLPPPTITSKKSTHHEDTISKKISIERDPFFAAMVECSKDETSTGNLWNGSAAAKVSRSVSDRFGFISLYGSCKRTCAVSESLVYLPSSRRSNYEHVSTDPQ